MFFTVDKCPSGCKIVLGLLGMVVPDLGYEAADSLRSGSAFFIFVYPAPHA